MIVSAMNCHLDSADVQHYGCAALCCLAENDINKVAIANAGGIDVIESAKRNHSSNAHVQEKVEEALCILTPTQVPTSQDSGAKSGCSLVLMLDP